MIFQPPLKTDRSTVTQTDIYSKQASKQSSDGQTMDGGMDGQIGRIKETGGCLTENWMDTGGLGMTGKVRVQHLLGIQSVAGQSMD